MAKRRNKDLFVQALFKSGSKGPVPGRGSLEADMFPDMSFTGNLFQVVFPYGMYDGSQDLFDRVPIAKQLIDVPLHKYSAAVTGKGRFGIGAKTAPFIPLSYR